MTMQVGTDSTQSKPPAPVPQWVGFMIAVLLVGSMMAAGGYWIWARATQPPRSELVEVQGLPLVRTVLNTAPPPANVTRSMGTDKVLSYTIRSPDAVVTAKKGPSDPDWTLRFTYNRSDLMTADQTTAITARFRYTSDPAFAKGYKVTEDQLKKLKEVPTGIVMVVSPADQKKMIAAITAYNAAPKPASEPPLIKALSEISAASLTATRASVVDRVKAIQAVLTPEQIAPFK